MAIFFGRQAELSPTASQRENAMKGSEVKEAPLFSFLPDYPALPLIPGRSRIYGLSGGQFLRINDNDVARLNLDHNERTVGDPAVGSEFIVP